MLNLLEPLMTKGSCDHPGTKKSTQKGRQRYSLGTRLLCEPKILSLLLYGFLSPLLLPTRWASNKPAEGFI